MIKFLRRITLLGAIIGAVVWVYQNLLQQSSSEDEWVEADSSPDLR
jgi:hypothetical protein